ncbi:MAG: hypothetical protein QOC79_189, partial [Actinomycetota bacterium]|nr:hypothetical protein [Actinomycetota bacterium]
RASGRDPRADAFRTDVLTIVELDAEERIAAIITFDPNDFHAAIAELDAHYLAGEAAPYSAVWSTITEGYAALNRHERPLMTADVISVDHRRGRAFVPGDLPVYLDASWELMPQSSLYIDDVHRLNDIGTVVTHVVHGTTAEGFVAEWREINVLKAAGDRVSRCEMFDEDDLDAALASFEELHPRSPRLENAVAERFLAHFAARNWDALAQDFAETYYCDDRRRVVNAGLRQGRDAAIEDLRVAADIGLATNPTFDIIATRGERRILTHWRGSGPDRDAIQQDVLQVLEHDADDRIAAAVLFDVDEIGAAFEELDARYMAGEAAAYAHTWSLVAEAFAAINRHELPERTPDWVNVDHRRGAAFAAGEMTAYIDDLFDDVPDIHVYAEVLHRLGNLGAVITQAGHGTSQEGFQAERREIGIFMFDGDLLSHYELFDEADLDAALARFDELNLSAPQLENAASQVEQRFLTYFAARDWDAYAAILSDDVCIDDRRHVVNAGVRRGRDAEIANVRALADIGVRSATSTVIAVRGGRLFLGRHGVWGGWSDSEVSETLCVLEINAENQIVARVLFDADDIDAAFTELEARYLAGEAAARADTWSVIASSYAAFNRHELPAADWDTVDHRRATPFASSTMTASLRAIWDLTPDLKIHIEAVHRLDSFGAVITHTASGSSPEGFDAEWRAIDTVTVQGDRINRCEIFDEADLDAAITKFDQLSRPARRLENTASHVAERFLAYFAASDWDAMAEILADNSFNDDRRRVVNAGVQRGRDAQMANMRAIAELFSTDGTSTVMATRAARLVLVRLAFSVRGQGTNAFQIEVLGVVEIDTEDRIAAFVAFDT